MPRAGATFAVALDEPGNWQKVIGWRDLSATTVGLQRSAWEIGFALVMDLCYFGIAILAAALVFGGPWAGLLAVVAMVLGAIAIVVGAARHNRQIERALHAVSAGSGGTLTEQGKHARHRDPTAPAR